MDRTIRQITDKLVSLLPDDDQYYDLNKLRQLGFPRFIVNRIQVELEKNLAESMRPPQTDWANIGSERVQRVWQEFISAIRAEARLPASYAKTVIETAVADVLEVLIQPRKNIPDVIFGTEKTLSLQSIKQRTNAIVVYRHFATLLPRYMEKKGLDELSFERCKKVVIAADEKMTSRYSPLNWAQMLEPLFNLMNEQIDTSLLRLFFEDKKMPRIARQFDLMDSAVDRAKLIEVLSSPDSLNFEGYEEDQSELFGSEEKSPQPPEKPKKEEPVVDSPQGKSEEAEIEAENDKGDPVIDNFHAARNKPKEKLEEQEETEVQEETVEEPEEEQESEESTLNTVFGDEVEQEEEPEESDEDVGSGLNSMFNTENGQEKEHEEAVEDSKDEYAEEEAISDDEDVEITEAPKAETPMWQRYMSPEDIEAMEAEQEAEQVEVADEKAENEEGNSFEEKASESEDLETDEEYIDEPVVDLTQNNSVSDDAVEELQLYLEDDREFFVSDIFRDSERAYEEALEVIAGKDDWKSASKFIDKNVFKRNLVDMYSEAAVDFTDRLQSYFIEKSKSQ